MRTIAIAFLATLGMLATGARATDWSGAGGNNDWSTPGNWSGGAVPDDSYSGIAIFGPAAATFTPFVDVPWHLNRFDATGGPFYNFTGNTISLSGAGAQMNLGSGVAISNPLEFFTTVALTTSSDIELFSALTGAGGMTKLGPGRLWIRTPTMYSGTTTVSAGVLQLGVNGNNLSVDGAIVNNSAVELTGPVQLLQGMSGPGSLAVLGAIVTSGATFTHTGSTYVGSTSWLAGQFLGGGPVTIEGRLDAGSDSVFASVAGDAPSQLLLLGGPVTIGADDTSTSYDGALSGAGDLVKVGSGRLSLGSPTYYTGSTTISAGTLRIGNGVAAPSSINGPIANAGALEFFLPPFNQLMLMQALSGPGTLTVLGGVVNTNGQTLLTHTGATTIRAGGALWGPIPNGGPLTVDAGGDAQTQNAVLQSVSGAGSLNFGTLTVGADNTSTAFTGPVIGNFLTKVGSGRLTLAGPTVHGGGTFINAGTLRFGDGVGAPATITGQIFNNGVLEFHATTGTTVTGIVSGSGTLRVLGGIVDLTAQAVHDGATIVDGGVLSGSFMGHGSFAIAAGARLNVAATGLVTTVTGAGVLDIDFNGLGVGLGNSSFTFDGVVSGVGGIFNIGTGTLTLTGASTSTGLSGVSQGRLLVTGSLPGPFQTFNGGTLGGTGTLGPVFIDAGTTIAPGVSPGIINTGNLNIAGIALIEIEGTTIGAQYDSINVTGTVTLAGATLTLAGAHVPAPGSSFTIISNDGVDPVVGTFAGLPEGATVAFNGQVLTISYVGGTGNDVVLAMAAAPAAAAQPIPTLSAWALMILALSLTAVGARRLGPQG